MKVTLENKTWENGTWFLTVLVEDGSGTRSGPQNIEGPEGMTDAALKAAVAALYAPTE